MHALAVFERRAAGVRSTRAPLRRRATVQNFHSVTRVRRLAVFYSQRSSLKNLTLLVKVVEDALRNLAIETSTRIKFHYFET